MPDLVNQITYARHLGVHKSHVTRLKQQGRLVMRGRLVDVVASDQLLDATESPLAHHRAAADAHADGREKKAHASAHDSSQNNNSAPGTGAEGGGEHLVLATIGARIKYEQLRKMTADAEVAMMERDEKAGTLLDANEARRSVQDAGITLRSTLESLPDRLSGPLSVETSPERIHGILVEAIEQALAYAAEQLAVMGVPR